MYTLVKYYINIVAIFKYYNKYNILFFIQLNFIYMRKDFITYEKQNDFKIYCN